MKNQTDQQQQSTNPKYLSPEDSHLLMNVIRFVLGLTLTVNFIIFSVIFLVQH